MHDANVAIRVTQPTGDGSDARGCLAAAVLVAVPLALFLLGFVLVFQDGPRAWVATTFVGCDGDVTTVHIDDADEPGLAYYCDVDGRERRIDLPLLLVAFSPFVVLVVLPTAGYLLWRRRRGRRGSVSTRP